MPESIHERATKVIAKIIDLSNKDALKKIEIECEGDPELKKAVEALYSSIVGTDKISEGGNNAQVKTSLRKSSDKSARFTTYISRKWFEKVFENKRIRTLVIFISLIILFLIGVGIRFQVRDMLIHDTARHLSEQVFAQHLRLNEWIENGKQHIRAIASNPEVVQIAKMCDSLQLSDPSLSKLMDKLVITDIQTRYKLSSVYSTVHAGIISKEGARILATFNRYGNAIDTITGIRLGKGLYNAYLEAMEETVFVKPLSSEETIYKSPDTTNQGVICIFLSPVTDENGELLGVLYNTYLAREEFSKILSRIHFGKKGETYAFDKKGRMLSSGRFIDELRKNPYFGMSGEDETIYNIILKDPGGNISGGHVPRLSITQLPFVEPLQGILIELEKGSGDTMLFGTVSDVYRNYRGKNTISSWVWWKNYQFGIISEIATKEALTTIKYFDYVFIALYLIILMLSYFLYSSNVKIFRFGKRIESYKKLGQYNLKEKLGEGGFGEVYMAEHAFLKSPVAIKVLKKQYNGTDMLERFQKEVKVTSSLVHPNTVKVYDYGTSEDQQFYYVMEFLNGISLDRLVQKEGSIGVARGTYILLEICNSLREAHGLGLIHRDIKPMNIMLCNQGGAFDVVKVLDFGLVKSIDTDDTQQTQINRIGGTPMFMAPERIRDPFNTDQRVDIYSLGALGVYMFSGKFLLELVSQKMLSGEHTIQGDFKNHLIDRDDVPAGLKELLIACMSFQPDGRPNNIEELIEKLEAITSQHPWTRKEARDWWKSYDVYS